MAKEANKEKALAALLTCRTVTAAAKECGISLRTMRRYLEDEDFRRDFRSARTLLFENAVSRVQAGLGEAAEALHRNLNCDNPAVEIRAAAIMYDIAHKGVETLDILERLEALENEHNK